MRKDTVFYDGVCLPRQVGELLEEMAAHKERARIAEIFLDTRPCCNVMKRPGIRKMYEYCKSNKNIKRILVNGHDRFSMMEGDLRLVRFLFLYELGVRIVTD